MWSRPLDGHTPVYISDLLTDISCRWIQCVLRRQATSSCRGHVDESATGLSLSPHHEHGTRCRHSWTCCGRPYIFVANWKHFCSSLLFNKIASAYCIWKTSLYFGISEGVYGTKTQRGLERWRCPGNQQCANCIGTLSLPMDTGKQTDDDVFRCVHIRSAL